jgi:hypothetical protein
VANRWPTRSLCALESASKEAPVRRQALWYFLVVARPKVAGQQSGPVARTIRFPGGLRGRIAADADRCRRSFERRGSDRAISIPSSLFDRLRAQQGGGDAPSGVASFGEAVWLHTDMGPSSYWLGDGREVVIDAFEPDAPPRLAAENEAVSAFVCAAKNLSCPEILESLPARPPEATECPQCHGTRWWQLPGQWSGPGKGIIVCPRCAGRGWTG